VKAMENKEIIAGEPIVLECMASGSPKPKLTWRKDGKDLLVTERHFFTADDQLLVIVDTDLSDAGTYECEMSNSLGTEQGFSQLSVIPGERLFYRDWWKCFCSFCSEDLETMVLMDEEVIYEGVSKSFWTELITK
jgi:hypothetical protein